VEHCFSIYMCSSIARKCTLGVLYGYKVVFQAVTVIMALKTRKVKVRGLDDYREIIMATYLTSFVLVIVLIVNYTVEDMINTFISITSLSFFIGATAIILLVFVPKVTMLGFVTFLKCLLYLCWKKMLHCNRSQHREYQFLSINSSNSAKQYIQRRKQAYY